MAEEQTIMYLASDTRRLLNSLEANLDASLRRDGIKDSAKSEARPQHSSVVAEIIELMHENNKRLSELTCQIKTEVLIMLDRPDKSVQEKSA